MAKRTSAIVLCHNYGKFLMHCLDSVLGQTRPFDEILLIDDDSQDNTYEIWDRFYRGRVRYEKTKLHNQTAVRQHGFNNTSGDFLVFIDADDWLAPTFHEKMVRPLLANPQAGFVYCGFHIEREGDNLEWFRSQQHLMRPFDFKRLWVGNYCAASSMTRREAWCGHNRPYGHILPDGTAYGEDWDAWLEISRNGWQGELVAERLYSYRLHGANTSRPALLDPKVAYEAAWDIKQRHLAYDLTVIFLYSGKKRPLPQCLEFLKTLKKPDNTQVLFMNGVPAMTNEEEIKAQCTDYVVIPREKPLAGWKRYCLDHARYYARGKKILILSDHYLFDSDLYERLNEGMEKSGPLTAVYSARVWHEEEERVRAWRASKGDAVQGIYYVPLTRRPKRVFAAALEGSLMAAEMLHASTYYHYIKGFPYLFAEALIGDRVQRAGLRWFADGRIRSRRERKVRPLTETPEVSIIIPVRNSEDSLKKLLQSLREVDYPRNKMEILVVDNNSTDDTAAVAASFKEVKLLHERKQSSYAARSLGIRESRYELLAFVDADCTVSRSWLKDLVNGVREYSWLGAVAGQNQASNEEKVFSRMERETGGYLNYWGTPEFPPYLITMNVIFRKQVFRDLGSFDEDQISGSDAEMSWRMLFKSAWGFRILPRGGRVLHKDAVSFNEIKRRSVRIGEGLYGIYQKYPQFLSPRFYWMPLTRLELFVQYVKTLLGWEMKTRGPHKNTDRGHFYFFETRHFMQKCGFLNAILKSKSERKTANGTPVTLFIGSESLKNESSAYAGLREKADAGERVLHVDPAVSHKNPFMEYLSWQLGLTTVWHWRPNLQSLEFWEFPGSEKRNMKLNLQRIRKVLEIAEPGRITITGNVEWSMLRQWKEALETDKIFPGPIEIEPFGKVTDVSAPCVLAFPESLGPEEIKTYQDIAAFSLWPVIVAGCLDSDAAREAAQKLTAFRGKARISFLELPLEETSLEPFLKKAGLCLCASVERVPRIFNEAPKHLPVVVKIPSASVAWPASWKAVPDFPAMTRAAQAAFHFPLWPLTSGAVQGEVSLGQAALNPSR